MFKDTSCSSVALPQTQLLEPRETKQVQKETKAWVSTYKSIKVTVELYVSITIYTLIYLYNGLFTDAASASTCQTEKLTERTNRATHLCQAAGHSPGHRQEENHQEAT